MNHSYIKIVEVEDKQKILLYLFEKFHEICEQHNLIYNAFGGTMLGAIRHKGFIPWDDDVDVTMPRNDYNKLLKIVKSSYREVFNLHTYPDDNYIYPYTKLGLKNSIQIENLIKMPYAKLSINIDIFPVDGYPANEDEIDEYCSYEENIILCTYKINKFKFIRHPKYFAKMLYSINKGYKYWIKKQILLASKNKVEDSDYLICNGAGWGRKGIIKKDVYFDRILYNFENISIWGIRDYDEHMKKLYGNYLKMPPKNKRVSPHNNSVYIKKKLLDNIICKKNLIK